MNVRGILLLTGNYHVPQRDVCKGVSGLLYATHYWCISGWTDDCQYNVSISEEIRDNAVVQAVLTSLVLWPLFCCTYSAVS